MDVAIGLVPIQDSIESHGVRNQRGEDIDQNPEMDLVNMTKACDVSDPTKQIVLPGLS